MTTKKQAKLIAITHSTGSHLRGWRHPNTPAFPATDIKAFIGIAQELERGLFDGIFISETTGVMPGPNEAYMQDSMVNDSLDPTLLLAAVASATKHIGLITTASTSLTQPRSLARLLASLDHLSNGRAGWNMVTSRFETEARNFGLDPSVLRSPARYKIAMEFIRTAKKIWDGSPESSFKAAQLPQKHPVIIQAGMSEEAKELIAREADLMLSPGGIWQAKASREDIRKRAEQTGRNPDSIAVIALLPSILVAETRQEAEALLREFIALLHPAEQQQHGILAGTPDDFANIIEEWIDKEATDGFAIGFPYLQGQVAAFTRLVIPELQRRGIFRTSYTGATFRENLSLE